MKILVICGVYDEKNENEVLRNTKGYAEQSANIFQRKLIKGIEKNGYNYKVISAPLIGPYPTRYKQAFFRGFSNTLSDYKYVNFNNVWGIRSLSRAKSLKRAIRDYLAKEQEEEFLILVYCAHTPFLEAAKYAKDLKPKSKICLIVPDLPQYMNLNEGHRFFYDLIKKYDIKKMQKYIDIVDSFVLLTEPMKEVLNVGNRPYMVVEGIIDEIPEVLPSQSNSDGIKRVVYTGKMNMKFGIKELVDSFMKIKDENYRLILCGDGDARMYVEQMAKLDFRIEYKGQVPENKAKEYIQNADVLVNPRQNNEEYTKYSFPSKTIEYLLSGKPVVAYMLDGMPECYREILCVPNNEISETIIETLSGTTNEQNNSFFQYAKNNLSNTIIISKLINMTFNMQI